MGYKCIICGFDAFNYYRPEYQFHNMYCHCGISFEICNVCFGKMDGYIKFDYDSEINVHVGNCKTCERDKKISEVLNG